MALRQMEGIPAALWMKEGNILLAGSGLRGLRATLRGKSSPGVKMAGIRVLAGMVDRGVSERVLRVVANETVRLLAGKQAADLFVQTVEMIQWKNETPEMASDYGDQLEDCVP